MGCNCEGCGSLLPLQNHRFCNGCIDKKDREDKQAEFAERRYG